MDPAALPFFCLKLTRELKSEYLWSNWKFELAIVCNFHGILVFVS